MTMALIIDASALERLQHVRCFTEDWFVTFAQQELPRDVARIEVNENIYLLGPAALEEPRLLVVSLVDTELFSSLKGRHRNEAFRRIVTIGRLRADPQRIIPVAWAPFHAGSKLSIQAVPYAMLRDPPRIEFDQNPLSTGHTYAYATDVTRRRLEDVNVPLTALNSALAGYDEAAITRNEWTPPTNHHATPELILSPFGDRISMGITRKEWLNGRLTESQQRFIHAPIDRSLRLIGAAGTGKTLSLVLKCIAAIEAGRIADPAFRCLFLTHSQSTVDTVRNALYVMDDSGVLSMAGQATLQICTLLELANLAMRYDLYGLRPLSTDGIEGRIYQREAIIAQIQQFRNSDWIAYRARCSPPFVAAVESDPTTADGMAFANAVISEINCVLEADGVKDDEERRARYRAGQGRKSWMMPLTTEADRAALLTLYNMFRQFLREMNVIGAGQMIADYLGFLDNNLWNNARRSEGWDVIFVDELHLFNRQERLALHQLTKDPNQLPKLIMAYDNKQSVNDSFYRTGDECREGTRFPGDVNAGRTVPFELTQGFRYTPAIADVLEKIDQTYPNLGLPDELGHESWKPVVNLSRGGEAGERPTLYIAPTDLQLFNAAFSEAKHASGALDRRRKLAVLCLNEALFRRYAEAGQYRDDFVVVADREDVAQLRYAGRRYILSMPEFVAGMQFDTVYVIHANDGDVEGGIYAQSAFRRYVSAVYLAASRAERVLRFYASNERGGPSRALRFAAESEALETCALQR